jgi:urease accessory protein
MSDLIIIQGAVKSSGPDDRPAVRLAASRGTLAKRRWRGVAEDGRQFGFDLEQALPHGACFFAESGKKYVLEQEPEEVLEIVLTTPEQAASVAWNLGNLHFGVQILPHAVRVADDPAVQQFLHREGIGCRRVKCVFLPRSAGAHHHHHHE